MKLDKEGIKGIVENLEKSHAIAEEVSNVYDGLEKTHIIAKEIINLYEKHNVKGFFSVEVVKGIPVIASVPNIPHDEIMARLRAIVEIYYMSKERILNTEFTLE